ncbi:MULTISPECIES: membrane protein [Streptomyces]|uniref:Membrane protein n=2 Tax=Streptomyces albus subsp. albus TaxID=67257 RepID=H6D558_STRA4|nr:membrane protein [Streptomyces sp. SCSIO ZS0520]AEZ53934.1 putative membrane protein [Streptomyces albus]CCD31879.1 membrane protein [Streptomyces albus subsp. albus]AJE80667.1 membrane protein [Streptomyces albus]AOU74978.1 membrane protein [Streptomyces albus]AYN30787.1 membrane protein [Streptomyces albus]
MPQNISSPKLLAGLLAGAGLAHLAVPRVFDAMVPRVLPGPARTWTQASAAVEFALAAGVAWPRTRRIAAKSAAAFFVGVFPGNVQMALDWRTKPAPLRNAALARLPLQAPLVLWAHQVGKKAGRP